MNLKYLGVFFLSLFIFHRTAIGQTANSNYAVESNYSPTNSPVKIELLKCDDKRAKVNPPRVICNFRITASSKLDYFYASNDSNYSIIDYFGRQFYPSSIEFGASSTGVLPAGIPVSLSLTFTNIPADAGLIRLLQFHKNFEPQIRFFDIPLAGSVPKPPQIIQTAVDNKIRFNLSQCKREPDSKVACSIFVSSIDADRSLEIQESGPRALLNSGQEYRTKFNYIEIGGKRPYQTNLVENVPILLVIRFEIPKDTTNIRYLDIPIGYGNAKAKATFENIPIIPSEKLRPLF